MERVIKAGRGAAAGPRRRIAAEHWQAGERAAALLACAEAEAAGLRRDACAELAARRAEADAEGFQAGLARAAAALLEAEARRDAALGAAEDELLDLALELARRLVVERLERAPEEVRGAAVEALLAARGRRRVSLHLHPEAAAALGHEAGPLAALAALPAVELVADPALGRGDVLVETEAGAVDGRLEVRLAALGGALRAARP
jgi:flagellar biosynthesis/type III secretory pathway protein FliH